MKLYDYTAAPNPRRVRVFLAEKALQVPLERVNIMKRANRAPEFLAKNPFGTIPVLELDDGTFISESVAICRYFEEEHPDPPLFGVGARERAEVEMWNRRIELILLNAIGMVWMHGSPLTAPLLKQIEENVAPNRKRAARFFEAMDGVLSQRRFVVGDRYSIADISALIAVDFAKLVQIAPEPQLEHVARWYAEVSARPSATA
jgi:glutathione S-transferase